MAGMGKVEINIPLVTWRDGRPRFFPAPSLRLLGYKGEDLRHGRKGAWFSLDEAIAWSKTRQAEIEAARAKIDAGEVTPKSVAKATRRAAGEFLSVAHVMTAFRDLNPRMQGVAVIAGKRRRKPLSPGSIRNYAHAISQLERFEAGAVWAMPAADLTADELSGVLERYEEAHGLSQTRALRATISAVYSWAKSRQGKRLVAHNPVAELTEDDTLPVLDPRVRYGTVPEMLGFMAVCDALATAAPVFADIGDSISLGLYSGQRQNDRFALEDTQLLAEGIRFTQRKKGGQPLLIPMISVLRERLAAAAERRRDWRVNYPNVLLDSRTRRPWETNGYGKVFRVARHVAAFGDIDRGDVMAVRLLGHVDVPALLAALEVAPIASLAEFRDQDLRDTAVTWLSLAECTKLEIASITGHSLKSIDQILSHYFGLHPDLARNAMRKLDAWWRKAAG